MADAQYSNPSPNYNDDLSDLFGPLWKEYWPDKIRPHALRVKEGGKIAAVICKQSDVWKDWAFNQNAKDYMVAVEREGKTLRGYVVLANEDLTAVVAWMGIQEVVKRIGDTPPLPGDYHRPFWWLNKSFELANKFKKFNTEDPYSL